MLMMWLLFIVMITKIVILFNNGVQQGTKDGITFGISRQETHSPWWMVPKWKRHSRLNDILQCHPRRSHLILEFHVYFWRQVFGQQRPVKFRKIRISLQCSRCLLLFRPIIMWVFLFFGLMLLVGRWDTGSSIIVWTGRQHDQGGTCRDELLCGRRTSRPYVAADPRITILYLVLLRIVIIIIMVVVSNGSRDDTSGRYCSSRCRRIVPNPFIGTTKHGDTK
mmetsp:Transcript_28798/g.52661  ORF Transcript_28798/g.52661 Transcript_28798/m.52661 type:complete len:222 (+) Transcript_28798:219-884(+)